MQSKRTLKKQIRYICGDLVGECLLIGEICPAEKLNEVNQLIVDLAVLQESTIQKTNFSYDKSPRDFSNEAEYRREKSKYVRAAFATLHKQFNASLSEAVHRMNLIAGLAKNADA
ncbi:MAG: hypothetical protein K2M49_01110 [Muribaculaceae bacterium]|nr:hypothetical protein [Muribaculaceae bacterium]